MKTKTKLFLIGLLTLATILFCTSCKKKNIEPVQTTQTSQVNTLDTNYVTIKVKWSGPAGSSMKYYIMTGLEVVSTVDTFQYKRSPGELLMVQLNTNNNLSAPLSFTFCALSNKHLNSIHGDTIFNQVFSSTNQSVLEAGFMFN